MFIAIVGTHCSGKSTVERYLISKGFLPVRLTTVANADVDAQQLTTNHTQPVSEDATTQGVALPMTFASPGELLDHVTRHWRSDFVIDDLTSLEQISLFARRPFFMAIKVDAPLMQRYHRLSSSLSLEEFVYQHDECVFGTNVDPNGDSERAHPGGLHAVFSLVKLTIINTFQTVSDLHDHLDSLNILSAERLRPRWDCYFMTLADLASQRSNCMKRRVGAILVRENRIVATGYNGTPRGVKNCNEGGCGHCNGTSIGSGTDCLCLHAEENALLEAGRDRVGPNAILYCNTCPCLKCTIKIIQSGVREVVYHLRVLFQR